MKPVRRDRPNPPSQTQPNPWGEVLKVVGLSLFMSLGIRHFIAEARYIPTESMVPTLQVNDHLVVEKLSYRFHDPARGDVVVFMPREDLQAQNPDFRFAFIKRVIGLPGETVQVINGQVLINGQPLDEPYIAAEPTYVWGPAVVPDDAYLVLGDNRNNSLDSHFWGYVPRETIIGRAAVRFWPPDRLGSVNPNLLYPDDVNQQLVDEGR
ncbi:MAG TPA: signal peptidase I [Candidatus Obscuribacterales bacterium]